MNLPGLFTTLAAALTMLAACGAQAGPPEIPLKLPSGKTFRSEVMIEDADRAMGLMFRPSLPRDRALLFVFPTLDFHGIWMKNCRFAIDIIWLDERRTVVHVAPRVPPCEKDPCPVYQPMRRAAFVVEMNAGQADEQKVTLGTTLKFKLPR